MIVFLLCNIIIQQSSAFMTCLVVIALLSALLQTAIALTSTPYLSPNPVYSEAGIYIFDTTPYFNSATTSFNPSTFTISFAGRTHSSTNYSFGYSINHITYTISNHQVNYTLASTSKTSTSVTMSFYTNNANKISNLAIAYILIQPLFPIFDFYSCWIKPNSNINNGQNFQGSLTSVGPFTSTTQSIWTALVGVDASLNSGNDEIDLYAMSWLPNITSIQFQISTISNTPFYLSSVLIQVFIYDSAQLLAKPRSARFTTGERDKNSGLSYTNAAMQSYNTIYGIRTYHTSYQSYLNYQWTLSSSSLAVSTTNGFYWVAFDYLILQFITCASTTPYLMISNSTCYDLCPIRYYADEYNQCQSCPYDCSLCFSNGTCSQCSNSSDYRYLSTTSYRCVPLDGYYDDNVSSQAIPCNASACKTCLTLTFCLTCYEGSYLSNSNTCLNCTINCLNCTSSSDCQNCSAFYVFQSTSCVLDCSNITNCSSCTLSNQTVICNSCSILGYNITNNACTQLCGNGIRTQSEACDDGNANDGDGCSSTCSIQVTFYCIDSSSPNNLSICSHCSDNCTDCSNLSNCSTCTANYSLINGTCSAVITSNATNSSTNSTNLVNTTNSTSLTNTTNSTVIDTTNLTNSTSSPANSTSNTTKSTNPINTTNPTPASNCGNALVQSSQRCDDGNILSNDGCNSQCQIEDYFNCSILQNLSICNLNSFNSVLTSLSKNPSLNEFTVNLKLEPSNLLAYNNLNWSNVVYQKSNLSIAMTHINLDQNTGQLSISYAYNQNLNENELLLGYNFPNSSPFSLLNNLTFTSSLAQEANNLSLQVYSDSTYSMSSLLYNVAEALSGLVLLIFILGFWKGKVILLELVTIFQLSFLSLMSLNKLSPTFYSLSGLSLSCGYALNLFESKAISNRTLNFKLLFFSNSQTCLIFVILPLLISIILSIVARVKKYDELSTIRVLALRMRNEWMFYGLMFSSYVCVISLGFDAMNFQMLNGLEIIGLGVDALFIAGMCLLGVKLVYQAESMGEFQSSFQKDRWVSSNYYFLQVLERLISGGALLMIFFSLQVIIIIALLLLQLSLIIILKPYKIKGRRRRPILNLMITLIIEAIYFLTPSIEMLQFKLYSPMAILGLLAISVGYNIYYMIKFLRSPKEKIIDENDLQVDEFKFLNSQRLKLDLNSTFLNDNPCILTSSQPGKKPDISSLKLQLNKIKDVNQNNLLQISPHEMITIETNDDFSGI